MKHNLSETTAHYRRMALVCGFFSALCMLGPLIYFCIEALLVVDFSINLSMGFMFTSAAILTVVNLCMKSHARTPFWIILLALMMGLEAIYSVLISMAIGCLLDELIFAPLHRYARNKASINREIDKRTRG